jgi:hypothetical protein
MARAFPKRRAIHYFISAVPLCHFATLSWVRGAGCCRLQRRRIPQIWYLSISEVRSRSLESDEFLEKGLEQLYKQLIRLPLQCFVKLFAMILLSGYICFDWADQALILLNDCWDQTLSAIHGKCLKRCQKEFAVCLDFWRTRISRDVCARKVFVV